MNNSIAVLKIIMRGAVKTFTFLKVSCFAVSYYAGIMREVQIRRSSFVVRRHRGEKTDYAGGTRASVVANIMDRAT